MKIGVFDFFSGCGGTSKGFSDAGLVPAFALDFDDDAANTFVKNFPDTEFCKSDIRKFDAAKIGDLMSAFDSTVFSGCAPCQPFTMQNTQKPTKEIDRRRSLLSNFGALVKTFLPDYIFVENVPGIQKVGGNSTLARFQRQLVSLGYSVSVEIIEAQKFGVPQRRRRLVLLASRHGKIELPEATHGPGFDQPFYTVRESIAHFPPISAGEMHPSIPSHQAAHLSELNLERIKSTPHEGSRAQWPEHLRLKCHTKSGYKGHTDVYGRMRWDSPATGLTTRCISLSNGRYGHPEQHRAISGREAAALQTFPDNFIFEGSLNSQAKQIGNAVPVQLAKVFGKHIVSHAENWAA